MVVIEGAILDYNATTARGYHEISAAYAFLGRAIRGLEAGRTLRLLGPLQYKCWQLTLQGRLDDVVEVFSNQVLRGENADYVERFARDFDITQSGWKWALGIPKVGKKMDTSLIPGAIDFARAAHRAGKKTGIYSGSFKPFIYWNLRRKGVLELFNEIEANEWEVGSNGRINGMRENVNCHEKGKQFKGFLNRLGLRETGEAVAYAGDTEQDRSVFGQVQHPIVAPTAKDEFRESCRYDKDFGSRVLTPKDWTEPMKTFELNGK